MTARGCSVHRRPLPERSADRQVRLNGAARGADGRIDRSKMRDSPWDPLAQRQVVWLFGTRVAEIILASGPKRPHQQAGHMDASDPIRPQKPLVPRGPSTYGSLRPVRNCALGRDDKVSASCATVRPCRRGRSRSLRAHQASGSAPNADPECRPARDCSRDRSDDAR